MYTRDTLKQAMVEFIRQAYASTGNRKYKMPYRILSARWSRTCTKLGNFQEFVDELVDEGKICIGVDEARRFVYLPLANDQAKAAEEAFIRDMKARGIPIEEEQPESM